MAAVPQLNELYSRYKDQGLVLIGVHTKSRAEGMADAVLENEIGYPVAADIEGKTVESFRVDSFPDYYLIDRSGKLRVADLANSDLERVIKILLKEKAPADIGGG